LSFKDEKTLGLFCQKQRRLKTLNKLSDDRIKELEDIDENILTGNMEIKTFGERIEELKQFIKKNEKLPSCKAKDKTEKSLGNFCVWQRRHKKDGKLSREDIDKLDSFGDFWFW
jgi:hypothetical protein